jgi:hypothetical protein
MKVGGTIMTRIRQARKRSVGFEALEGRLALSAGVSAAPSHIHAAAVRAIQHKLQASFKGIVSISGSQLNTMNLNGHIGPDRLSGYGTGTIANNQFQGGDAYLSNSLGSVHLRLSPFYVERVGKVKTRTFAISIVDATGKYAQFTTSTGHLTRWNVPARQNAQASFSGVFTL